MPDSTLTCEDAALELESVVQLPHPDVGEVFAGRYQVVRALGSGGMGAVYQVEHTELKKRYAVKFLRAERAGSARSIARFRREARLLAELDHDGITRVVDFGYYQKWSPYIVMEYLKGETLSALLKRKRRLELAEIRSIMLQVCQAMCHAHEHGVVHRDLKPSNIMLTRTADGAQRAKVLDFGIARAGTDADAKLTPTGADLGTPHYMAPEQARGERRVGKRADVYALGVILYEMASGAHPHPGDSYNAVMFHLLTQPPVSLTEVAPDCPRALRSIVERCLRASPEERYAGARELARALDELDAGRDAGEPARVRMRANRAGSAPLAAGLILSAVAVAVLWSNGSEPEPEQTVEVESRTPQSMPASKPASEIPTPVATDNPDDHFETNLPSPAHTHTATSDRAMPNAPVKRGDQQRQRAPAKRRASGVSQAAAEPPEPGAIASTTTPVLDPPPTADRFLTRNPYD